MLEGGSNDDIKQHVSNHFLEDCTSPEKMYSVDGFRKSVIMCNVLDCSEGHVCICIARYAKQSVPPL